MNQDDLFFSSEGDNWFIRNQKELLNPTKQNLVLKMISIYSIIPKNVLEIGASNGWQLNEINNIYGSKCTAVEPSELAIRDGKKKYLNVEFYQSLVSDLPFKEPQEFDLVIMNFVFHWISREKLFKSISEIDRVLSDNGFLIIGDFLPDYLHKVNYHHCEEGKVWTYKQNYAKIFECSGIYRTIACITGLHMNMDLNPHADNNNRIAVSLLRKNYDNYHEIKL